MSEAWAIPLVVRRSLRQHLLSTLVTAVALALASGLVMSVFAINAQARDAFRGGERTFDAVLGARGSPLQLVLNSIYHLETSPGNIPWSLYEKMKEDPRVETAVPYAVGDNYKGFRIVGTTEELFAAKQLKVNGFVFDSSRRQAVVGSFAADQTGLEPGSRFFPVHGVTPSPDAVVHTEDEYVVVGVMEPTNSPLDRVIFIPIEGIFRMGGHVLAGEKKAEAGEEIPDEYKEVSAVLVQLKAPQFGFQLAQTINRRNQQATFAWPIVDVVGRFLDKFAWVLGVLEMVAYLVVAVAAGSILASLYNTMNERRREFAILRALGASRRTVFTAIVAESATIATLGALLGFLVYGIVLFSAAIAIRRYTGVVLDTTAVHPALWKAPLAMIGLGALAGVLPAWKAYRTDVADNLVPHS